MTRSTTDEERLRRPPSLALRRSRVKGGRPAIRTAILTVLVALGVALGVGVAPAQAAWTSQTSALTAVIITATSCPTTSDCVQENTAGKFQYTSNGGTTWTASGVDLADSTYGMDCPSASTCFATGDNGNIYESNDHGVTWPLSTNIGHAMYGIDCPTTLLCYAVGAAGFIAKTADGGSTWTTSITTTAEAMYSVSCASTTVCWAQAAAGAVYKKQSGNDTWDQVATNAAMPDVLSPYTHSISCPTLTVCYTGGTDGTISRTSDGGSTWSTQTTGTTPDIYALSCSSATRCIAVGVANNSSFTDNGGATWTTETTGSGAAMYSVTWASGTKAVAGDAIGVPYVYTAPALPNGTTVASQTLTAGTLSLINASPGNITFPSAALAGADQVKTQTLPFDVNDATGSGTGWAITATSTQFTSGARTLPPGATNILSVPPAACDSGVTCTLATNSATFPFAMPAGASAPPASKMFNATADTGLGAQTFTPTWSLSIPANAYTGTFTSTWTFTLTSGP